MTRTILETVGGLLLVFSRFSSPPTPPCKSSVLGSYFCDLFEFKESGRRRSRAKPVGFRSLSPSLAQTRRKSEAPGRGKRRFSFPRARRSRRGGRARICEQILCLAPVAWIRVFRSRRRGQEKEIEGKGEAGPAAIWSSFTFKGFNFTCARCLICLLPARFSTATKAESSSSSTLPS